MQIWHLTDDAPRVPMRVRSGEQVVLNIGSWPIQPDQSVSITFDVQHSNGKQATGLAKAVWQRNEGVNSYWAAEIGPFERGERVTYKVHGRSSEGETEGPSATFRVDPQFCLAILWHQHQPIYKDTSQPSSRGSYIHPWVRLHAVRDYYSMAALVEEHPDLHLIINFTPSLAWQLADYTERGATDQTLELTLKPAEELTGEEQQTLLRTFFDAHWHHQIFPYPRYKELFERRQEVRPFSAQDLRDLQMWFNLAWFAPEFRDGDVRLVTGEVVSVRRFVEQGRGFDLPDVQVMVAEQYKIMRAVIPIHCQLQDRGQIEVSTTPFYHPILPLLVDTDQATIDRQGSVHPHRFAYPEDAEAQVRLAVAWYQEAFGQPPSGVWPAEGAVSQSVVPIFARQGIRWLATDQGVLARSGRWGYQTDLPDVLCQPYRVEDGEHALSVFFRETRLSDHIGFHYYARDDLEQAARDFLREIKDRFAYQIIGDDDRILTVVLDGENAWGAYRRDARPFLHALYSLLEADEEILTVTFTEYLAGNPERGVVPHPLPEHSRVYDLFTGSWIDENGSAPGVDLGTWIGEAEENAGWELLRQAREYLGQIAATPASAPAAFEALRIAEGSDWFWWFGTDQDSGNDSEFDDLFRLHLSNVYRALGAEPPVALERHIVPRTVLWTFAQQVCTVQRSDRVTVQTNCPGVLTWRLDDGEPRSATLEPTGG
jgi:alpha-amylase/alpha-mannosidase (GH57 family)